MQNNIQKPTTPERLIQFTFSYAPPLLLEAGVRHGVFDALSDGPRTLEQLSSVTNTSERGLRVVLNGLTGLQFLSKNAGGAYALTPESDMFLVSSKPSYVGGLFKHVSKVFMPSWMQLPEVVRTGTPVKMANEETEGTEFFHQFVEDLFPVNYPIASALGEALGVPRATERVNVLDLAAGSGVWGIGLAHKSPHVRVTMVDRAGMLPLTRRVAARNGVDDRCEYKAADILTDDLGTGYDIATLGQILHSFGEKGNRTALQRTFAALKPGGTVAIAEWLVNEERTGPFPGLFFALVMALNTAEGDTYSFGEISRWLADAGFTNARLLEIPGPSSLILADKPAR